MNTSPLRPPNLRRPVAGVTIFIVVIAAWLRWQYITGVGIHVDEFSTLWASHQVLDRGAPIMPSGVLYTRGLFSSYLVAASMAIGGESFLAGRLPSLLFGIGVVLAVLYIGRREWSTPVGLIAALGLALLPEAIEAGGRARFYAPLLFWTVLTIWFMYRIARGEDDTTRRTAALHAGFACSFILALYSQEQTILLYPALLLSTLLWRGPRYFRTRPALIAHGACVVAIAGRFVIEQLGQPGYFDAVQENIPYLGPFFDVGSAWQSVDQLFWDLPRVPWTVFALVAMGVALRTLYRRHGHPNRLAGDHQATLFFGLQLAAMLLLFLTIVGPSWRHPRYMLIVEPLWLLLGAAGMVFTVDRFLQPGLLRRSALIGIAIALVVLMWPDASAETRRNIPGYEAAFAYVADRREPGDIVISPQAAGCAFVLGSPCDYYAAGNDFEPYVIPRGDDLIDRWTGAPLLREAGELTAVMRDAPRVWLVVDGDRLLNRFEPDFAATVLEQFDSVFEERKVHVWLAEEMNAMPEISYVAQKMPPQVHGPIRLAGWSFSDPQPLAPLRVRLLWIVPDEDGDDVADKLHTSVRVVARDGSTLALHDGPIADGLIPPSEAEGGPIPDVKLLLLPSLADGLYRLDVVAYDVETNTPVADSVKLAWFRVGAPPEATTIPVDIRWQSGTTLSGFDALPASLTASATLSPRLVWLSAAPVPAKLAVFVHLMGPDGTIIAQHDSEPAGGFLPTTTWRPGQRLEERYALALPDVLAPGVYRLLVGWYDPISGIRVALEEGSDTLELATWTVGE